MLRKVLILGGTQDARRIAGERLELGDDVTTSLAGVTRDPVLPEGKIRKGGFGGAEGLRDYLVSEKIDLLIDATHPYAAIISANARKAVEGTSVQLEVFEREAWASDPEWIVVATTEEASQRIPSGAKVFITVGRRGLQPFLQRDDISGLIRSIEPPDEILPAHWTLLQQRPPYELMNEIDWMRNNNITHLVTKNSGGDATRAKLDAARALNIAIIMMTRT